MTETLRIQNIGKTESSIVNRSILLTILGVFLGIGVSVITNNFGWITLLSIPGLILFASTVAKPDIGISMLMFVLFAQVQRVFAEVNGWPGPGRPVVAFLLGIVAIRFLVFNERPNSWIKNSFIFLVYAILSLISVVTADVTNLAFSEFQDQIQNLVIASIILFIVQKPTSLKSTIWAIVLTGLFMTSISVFQRLTQTYTNNYFGFGGWEYSGYVGRPRMTGPYANPNPYVLVLVAIFVITLDRAWHEKKMIARIVAIFSAIICLLGIIFTDSRGGLLNLVFTVCVYFIFNRINISSLVALSLIGVLIVPFLPANFTERLLTLKELLPFSNNQSVPVTDESFRGRESENIVSWRMFLDNPVFGVGLDNARQYYLDYSKQIGLDPRREARDPASLYLHLLATQGLVGTIGFLAIMGAIFSRLYKTYKILKKERFYEEAHIASALFAAMAGYMFMSIYINNANSNVFWSLIALCIAVTQVAENMRIEKSNFELMERVS